MYLLGAPIEGQRNHIYIVAILRLKYNYPKLSGSMKLQPLPSSN
jgi:hypothetical protein